MDKEEACGGVAQSVEQRTENPRVDGSIPPPATRFDVKSNRSCQRRQDSFEIIGIPLLHHPVIFLTHKEGKSFPRLSRSILSTPTRLSARPECGWCKSQR